MPKTTNTRKPRASWDAPRITFLLKRYVKAVHQGLRTSNGQFKKGVADTFAAKLNEKFGDNLDGSQCSDKLNQLKREFAKVEAALRNSSGLGVKNGCIDAPPHVWEALVAAKGPLIPLRHAPFPNWEDSYFLFSGHTATGSEAPPPPGYGERVGDDAGGGGVAQQAASRATVAAGGMRPVGLRRQHGFDKTDAVDSNDDEDKENREKGNEDADELFVKSCLPPDALDDASSDENDHYAPTKAISEFDNSADDAGDSEDALKPQAPPVIQRQPSALAKLAPSSSKTPGGARNRPFHPRHEDSGLDDSGETSTSASAPTTGRGRRKSNGRRDLADVTAALQQVANRPAVNFKLTDDELEAHKKAHEERLSRQLDHERKLLDQREKYENKPKAIRVLQEQFECVLEFEEILEVVDVLADEKKASQFLCLKGPLRTAFVKRLLQKK